LKWEGKTGTILLENPAGKSLFASAQELQKQVGAVFRTSKQLSTVPDKLQPVTCAAGGVEALHNQTLYLH